MYQLQPEFRTPNMTSCVPWLVRNCISCNEKYGCAKCSTIGRFLLSFIISLRYTQIYVHIQKCLMISTTQLLYHFSVECLSPIKKIFLGKSQSHCVPNIAYFKLLLWCDENTVSGEFECSKSRSTKHLTPELAHIITTHSAESPLWYFINIRCFHVQNLFNWFSKHVW